MMGSFLTRALVMALGYAYPAYECFKTVEKNKPEIEKLRFWCQYWILVAVLTVFERVGDAFISWLPMYSEAKLAFFIYLWYPKTKGTTYVYDTFFRPYVAKHETEIDRNLLELRARAGDIAVLYWQKASIYGQTTFLEILQYVATQSQSSRSQPVQQRPKQVHQPPPTVSARQPAAVQQQPQKSNPRPPTSPAKSQARDPKLEAGPAPVVPPVQPQTPSGDPTPPGTETTARPTPSEAEAMQVESSNTSTNEDSNPPPQETVIEEAIRVTRGRLRKTRAAAAATKS